MSEIQHGAAVRKGETSAEHVRDDGPASWPLVLTREHEARNMPATMAAPDLPTIKDLAVKHKIDFRTLRRFFAGGQVRGKLVRAACEKAKRDLQKAAT